VIDIWRMSKDLSTQNIPQEATKLLLQMKEQMYTVKAHQIAPYGICSLREPNKEEM
jgi:hypothetical protein